MGWQNAIDASKSDEENIIALYKMACTKNSTAGSLNGRWNSQAKLAIDIASGKLTEDQVLEWIDYKTIADPPDGANYGEGQNNGFLSNY